ncbi:hypothetical protein HYFRA_00006867 [Hymenoscyphus fraxineus]|uniref:Uncharacterized protein n=1 Tax=Hymenoscyphus fraxineus TaxID=746836 RepID=A0A9N9PFG8_9HELO|nr:hypothetical protein HYFRA_00006867 [Hymenoscyphus fraxineus]
MHSQPPLAIWEIPAGSWICERKNGAAKADPSQRELMALNGPFPRQSAVDVSQPLCHIRKGPPVVPTLEIRCSLSGLSCFFWPRCQWTTASFDGVPTAQEPARPVNTTVGIGAGATPFRTSALVAVADCCVRVAPANNRLSAPVSSLSPCQLAGAKTPTFNDPALPVPVAGSYSLLSTESTLSSPLHGHLPQFSPATSRPLFSSSLQHSLQLSVLTLYHIPLEPRLYRLDRLEKTCENPSTYHLNLSIHFAALKSHSLTLVENTRKLLISTRSLVKYDAMDPMVGGEGQSDVERSLLTLHPPFQTSDRDNAFYDS